MSVPRRVRKAEDALFERIQQMQEELADLPTRDPAEVEGDPNEAVYYGLKIGEMLRSGVREDAEGLIRQMLESRPADGSLRLVAAGAYRQLGDPEQTMLQLAIGLALSPENAAIHRHLAHELMRRGERQAAAAVLEQGWEVTRKQVRRRDQDAERERYFAVVSGAPTV